MQATCDNRGDRLLITGDLNFSTVAVLWKKALPWLVTNDALCIDLSQVKSANSAGLALLIEWVRYAKSQNKTIVFKGLPHSIKVLAEISGLTPFFS